MNASNPRQFDVVIEETTVLDDHDIGSVGGGSYVAVNETVNVSVIDRQMNVEFVGVNRVPLVSAISVVAASP